MEQIAVLDGFDVTPVPGGGQNYSGGSTWFPGAPYRLQQDGLAGGGSNLEMEVVTPVPGGGQGYTGGSSWSPGFPYRLQQDGLAAIDITPVPGGGQGYTGGSSWSPGFPYRLQQDGLAGGGSNLEMEVVTPVPGGGQNYSGGSSWFPGAPYRLQQDGLAGAALRGALMALRSTSPSAPTSDAIARARTLAAHAMAALPAWARGSVGAVGYFAAMFAAMELGQSQAQARAVARRLIDSIG